MGKISLVIKREYLTRVKKRTFLLMTLLGPILLASTIIVPIAIAKMEDNEVKTIAIIDDSHSFSEALVNTKNIKFERLFETNIDREREGFENTDYYAILFIPGNILNSTVVKVYSDQSITLGVQMYLGDAIGREIERQILIKEKVDPDAISRAKSKSNIKVQPVEWTEFGEIKRDSFVPIIVGLFGGLIIYMFIFMYGTMVMRGVIEEKSSRIIELIVSSIKPFQLMMGKIIGVALVGLTQFFLWVLLTFTIVGIAQLLLTSEADIQQAMTESTSIMNDAPVNDMTPTGNENIEELSEMAFSVLSSINWGTMLIAFVFFFLGGYLLYSSLFAAIGGAVDNEADTQQFILPITAPLVIGLIITVQTIINNPDSDVLFWLSIIPFTSPVSMLARIPFNNVQLWELLLSGGLLIITFIFTTWLAGKIYRTGILMYGQKVGYKELWKWIRYKN